MQWTERAFLGRYERLSDLQKAFPQPCQTFTDGDKQFLPRLLDHNSGDDDGSSDDSDSSDDDLQQALRDQQDITRLRNAAKARPLQPGNFSAFLGSQSHRENSPLWCPLPVSSKVRNNNTAQKRLTTDDMTRKAGKEPGHSMAQVNRTPKSGTRSTL
ncbi:hypothetical protein CLAFUW4_12273 [Fulvia fulva]|uniref:Uncharacterized protein n=1 Tax=Passalora fulva TaxID=5499 RepID=A0A9Q8PEK3_PASFU|nr:uncharacterized protein CLAFUR5_11303 [Fulvia fulva]KAK4617812.1 hypothetical protein CLAFUR4_12278 [Fulvia fulva]KAK4618537.1 hypothetical protein CLAFUR0_12289 [Fulvia fulva]UJO21066.1 hypothetical protein CLAFUR5_11303 [Fulvia fulva]WPV18434.1 hypothetical protein CLAFUW4_12273 [Fulvia fulva]WPV33518.1 hypothetical protein CLAFUW7_12280 [Fulvia fulva]